MIQTLGDPRDVIQGRVESQSSIRPGDDSDNYSGTTSLLLAKSRNPVFALEMIQTQARREARNVN